MRCNLVTREEGATQFCVYFNNSDKTEKKNEFYAYREKERGGFCWKNPDIPLFSKEFKRKTTAEIGEECLKNDSFVKRDLKANIAFHCYCPMLFTINHIKKFHEGNKKTGRGQSYDIMKP